MNVLKPYAIYKHTNLINGKVYIGQSVNPHKRWNNGNGYLIKNDNGEYIQPAFAHAIIKYGWSNFSHEIIKFAFSQEDADNLEKQFIEQYKSTNPKYGYNILKGGKSGYTKQHIKKSSNSDYNIKGKNNPRAKKVAQYTKDGKLIKVWDYMTQACEEIDGDSSTISKCCRGLVKIHKGFVWKYYES